VDRPNETVSAQVVGKIVAAATPVLRLSGMGGARWLRNVKMGPRTAPWLQASYEILDQSAFDRVGPVLYLVLGRDGKVRYIGQSTISFKTRWRRARDAQTGQEIAHQLFHSQCWKHLEAEFAWSPESSFEVRVITAAELGEDVTTVERRLRSSVRPPWNAH
jgi:hypothetical protein